MATACLGIFNYLDCPDNVTAPATLTLGGALSTIALVGTFLNYTAPIHRFRRLVRRSPRTMGICLIAFMFICALVAFALRVFLTGVASPPYLQPTPWPVIGYAVFWESLGALSAATGIGLLIWTLLSPTQFTSFNARRYREACEEFLKSDDAEARAQLAQELQYSAKGIAIAAGSTEKYGRDARDILVVLARDKDFMASVADEHPWFARKLIEAGQAYHRASRKDPPSSYRPQNEPIQHFINAFAGACLASDDSVLQKEVEHYAWSESVVGTRLGAAPPPGYPKDSLTHLLFETAFCRLSAMEACGRALFTRNVVSSLAFARYREAVTVTLHVMLHRDTGREVAYGQLLTAMFFPVQYVADRVFENRPALDVSPKRERKRKAEESLLFDALARWLEILFKSPIKESGLTADGTKPSIILLHRTETVNKGYAELLIRVTSRWYVYRCGDTNLRSATACHALIVPRLRSAKAVDAIFSDVLATKIAPRLWDQFDAFDLETIPLWSFVLVTGTGLDRGLEWPWAIRKDIKEHLCDHYAIFHALHPAAASKFVPPNFSYNTQTSAIEDARGNCALALLTLDDAQYQFSRGLMHASAFPEIQGFTERLLENACKVGVLISAGTNAGSRDGTVKRPNSGHSPA